MKSQRAITISILVALLNVCMAGELEFEIGNRYLTLDNHQVTLYGINIIQYENECISNNIRWRCGEEAHQALYKIMSHEEKPVCVDAQEVSATHNRLIQVECSLGAQNINAHLVAEGWGLITNTPRTPYWKEAIVAKEKQKGIFQGGFLPPDNWRQTLEIDLMECGVCAARHQSLRRTKEKLKERRGPLTTNK